MPEELSSIIFSRRLLQSLIQKSSGVTAQDSAALARLAARRGVSYDFPVVWTDRVKTALLFFLKRRDALFDRWYARADHYIPPMKRMFVEAGLPGDLAYLPILESGFDPNAYSSAHAAGIWQFIPSTGRQYGLRQNYWLDERRDPLKATAAAIAYLDKLYGDFKNWHTALAAYNCGETRMGRAVMKAGTTKDFWALSLPDETMDYIPFFIAALVIAKNHDILELGFAEGEPFDPDTVSVRDCIDLAAAAEALGANADSLAALNPHILRGRTPPDMDGIRLYLPKGSAAKFKEWYDTIPDDRKTKFYRYSTKPGDNVASIAAAFNVSQDSLRKWNGIKPKTAAAGENVIVALPVNDTVPSALALRLNVSDWDTPGKIPNFGGTEFAELQSRGHGDGLTLRTGKKTTYKVRAGETLQAVADSFNVSVKELLAWNYMANPRALKAEHTLVVYLPPDSAAAAQDPEDSAAATSAKYTLKRVVKPGETFFGIAVELGVPVIELAEINGLNPKRPLIAPGYTLRYAPKPAPKPQAAAATATAAAEPAHKQHTGANKKAVRAPENAAADSAAVKFALYVVKPTDSIWRIAKNFGISADSLRETNNINDKSKVFPGDTLKIAAQPRKNTESGKDGK
ncbi:lytic transglycosylase [Fibrobacteres bacterium R8-0-B4]